MWFYAVRGTPQLLRSALNLAFLPTTDYRLLPTFRWKKNLPMLKPETVPLPAAIRDCGRAATADLRAAVVRRPIQTWCCQPSLLVYCIQSSFARPFTEASRSPRISHKRRALTTSTLPLAPTRCVPGNEEGSDILRALIFLHLFENIINRGNPSAVPALLRVNQYLPC